MITFFLAAALLAVAVLAILRTKKHFSGGGCCGSAGTTIRTHKTLDAPILGQTVLHIDGMTCKNCQARIENVINRFDGVACTVDLKKKTATVSYTRDISPEELIVAVEKLGYRVSSVC